ncbi:MAG: hypothetical protein ACLFWD_03995 [Anaerolineales bacterium]
MTARLGSALILIGIVPMVIFLVTSSAGRGDLLTLLAGAAVSALGLLLRRRRQKESIDGGRFQTLRRMMGEDAPSEEEEL